jgi:hypothetical protein
VELPGPDGEDVPGRGRIFPRPGDRLVQHGYLRQLRRGSGPISVTSVR